MILTPFPLYQLSARCFSNYNLALCIGGIKVIYKRNKFPIGHSLDPEVALWKDDIMSLLDYGVVLSKEAESRRLPVRGMEWIRQERDFVLKCKPDSSRTPWWVGYEDWHEFQRGLLVQANPKFYENMFTALKVRHGDGKFVFNEDAMIDNKVRGGAWLVNIGCAA